MRRGCVEMDKNLLGTEFDRITSNNLLALAGFDAAIDRYLAGSDRSLRFSTTADQIFEFQDLV